MKTNTHQRLGPSVLIALGIIMLFAHGLVFYSIRQHLPLSATVLSGVAGLILIMHLRRL